MTKQELVARLVNDSQLKFSRDKTNAGRLYDRIFEEITKALVKDGRFAVAGFGSFTLKQRAARKGIHPQTRQVINLPAKRVVVFRSSTELKRVVE